jgi:hypothetical protein
MRSMRAQLSSNLENLHDLLWSGTVTKGVMVMQLQPGHIEMSGCSIEGAIYKLLDLGQMSANS